MKMTYKNPTDEFMQGLPIGTGRVAGMIVNDPRNERLALNHEWLWRGTYRSKEPPKSAHRLGEVRKLLLNGDYERGTIEGNEAFGGGGGKKKDEIPRRVDPFQPAGDLMFSFHHGEPENYHRELDLDSGMVTVTYEADGCVFQHEYMAHLEEDLILCRISATEPFATTLNFTRIEDPECYLWWDVTPQQLAMDGHFDGGISFRVQADILRSDGFCNPGTDSLGIDNATDLIAAVNVGTSAKCAAPPQRECTISLSRLRNRTWKDLTAAHTAAYQRHHANLDIELDLPEPDQNTDERLEHVRNGGSDPLLPLLYAQYGRYLMVSCTANADLPPNLQGIWNDLLNPAWQCDYHQDINLQMNFWPTELGNLPEAPERLFTHIERFMPHGRKAAKDLYGCNGVWFPIQNDVWGRCTPESYGWAVWIGAAPWLAQHMWWHFEYTRDLTFLRDRAYPVFKEIAAFYEDYCIQDEQGNLQIVPSQSPENRFVGGGELPVSLCVSATMDVLLAYDLLTWAICSAELLDVDADKRSLWRDMRERLPSLKIGSQGQLQEWQEDFEEPEPQHRHMSHLIGVYPGDTIHPETTPELWKAAETALKLRMQAGGGHTGWSRAWTACLYARLGHSEEAWEHLNHLVSDFATDSLLDLHPPRIFQIEGNFGGAAAVLEMLLQSYREEMHFLPALPAAWPSGHVTGLRAKGNFTVALQWTEQELRTAWITSHAGRECVIANAADMFKVYDTQGEQVTTHDEEHRLCFPTETGRQYRIDRKT